MVKEENRKSFYADCHSGLDLESSLKNLDSRFRGNDGFEINEKKCRAHCTGEKIQYEVSYRNIKYPRLEFSTGKLRVILPPGTDPEKVIAKHEDWIRKKTGFIKKCLEGSNGKKIVEREGEEFKRLVRSLAGKAARDSKVRFNEIYYRRMKTKWASLSRKKNLTINTLMKCLPENLIEYIVFHEITHILERPHSENFWAIVSRRFPDHNQIEKELFSYWFGIGDILKIG